MLERAKRASHIDPPASSYAIMRRARPYRGENHGPGKDFHRELDPTPGIRERPGTITDLPAPRTKRWLPRRKAEVVSAVRGGLLSLKEACGRYTLTVEEFLAWQYSIDRHGVAGLRSTRTQRHR